MHRVIAAASTCILLCGSCLNHAMAAPVDCTPAAAAGKPAPPTPINTRSNAFNVLWHVGTQIEALADPTEGTDFRKIIADVQREVNGYYITVHPNQLGYWRGRPPRCAVNFMRAKSWMGTENSKEIRDNCNQEFAAKFGSDRPDGGPAARDEYRSALERVLQNLQIKEEQSHGKIVVGQMLLARSDFDYDDAARQLTLRKLPTTYCFLTSVGLSVNNVLAYQEPGFQINKGTFLLVPRQGSIADVRDGRLEALPFNLTLVEQLNRAFLSANVPLTRFSINVRRWNERMIEALQHSKAQNHIGGIFFEGGAEIISTKRRPTPRIDNFAEGIAWLLENTQQKIFVLMPGFWEKNELRSDAEIDELIPRLRTTVLLLDEKIGRRLNSKGTRHAICNPRVYLIPGSYGAPVHVNPLPPERDGHLAGTVTGEIKLLGQVRRELCGTS